MSFRLKTILGIALIEIILLSILIVSGLHYIQTSNEKQFQERANTTVKLLATKTTDAVIAMDLATLDSLVHESLRNSVIYVSIKSRTGAVLSEGGRFETAISDNGKNILSSNDNLNRIDISYPIMVGTTRFGMVELGLSTEDLIATMTEAKKWMLGVAGAEIIFVAIFGYMLGTVLTAQLSSLQAGARRVADGELGHQILVTGRDELAETAISFNKMSDSLVTLASKLENARGHL